MGPVCRPLLSCLLSGVLLVLSSGAAAETATGAAHGPAVAEPEGPVPAPGEDLVDRLASHVPVATDPGGDPTGLTTTIAQIQAETSDTVDVTLGKIPVKIMGEGGDSEPTSSERQPRRSAEEPQARPDGETRSDGRRPAEDDQTDERGDEDEDHQDLLGLADPITALGGDAIATVHDPLDTLRARAAGLLEEVERTELPHPDLETRGETEDDTDTATASTMPVVERSVPDALVASLFVLGGALATGGLVGLGGGKPFLGRAVALLRRIGWLAALPLFSKIHKDDVLDHPIRDQLVDAIRSTPGITVQQLRARFGLGYGTIVHHMRVLEHHHIVSSIREGRHRRLFIVGQVDHSERPKAALLANPKTGRIYALLSARPGLTQKDLARSVRVGGSTIHWHINRLRDAGLVEVRRNGRSIHYFPALKVA